ncbi:MAG: aminotransferase class V-fold PLP-dependent enzyme [Ruminococcus sp.]|nr:aminotransferase class V-fold PLP-dependent enzyme [Ruminococcus sp.]
MIYFDNGATTFPKPKGVAVAVNNVLQKYGANPGRSGHNLSLKSAEIMYECRKNLADFFKVSSPENVIFTSNCTSALNTVIKGVLKPGDHAVISSLEHNAVVRPLEELKNNGVKYTVAEYVPYDDEATINNFRNAMNERTRLVVCTHASNVFGFKLPVERIGALCRLHGVLFCVDAAQTAGVTELPLDDTSIDYLCMSGHKGLYGPMGTGALIINSDVLPKSLIQGGTGSMSYQKSQPEVLPDMYESGTPNLPGIAGLNEGIKFINRCGIKNIERHEMRLAQMLYDNLNAMNNIELYTQRPNSKTSVPVISFNIKDEDSEDVAAELNRFGIAVRAGLHCAPLAHESFGTIDRGTVRAVMSAFNNDSNVRMFVYTLNRMISSKKRNQKG